MNKDPEKQDLSSDDFDKHMGMYGTINKMLGKNPDRTYIGFVFASGRGVEKESEQVLLLNELKDGFYKLAQIEYNIKFIAKKRKNAYLVGIFSTGKRVFDHTVHTSFFDKQALNKKKEIIEEY